MSPRAGCEHSPRPRQCKTAIFSSPHLGILQPQDVRFGVSFWESHTKGCKQPHGAGARAPSCCLRQMKQEVDVTMAAAARVEGGQGVK